MGYFIGFECLDCQSIKFIISRTRSIQQSGGQVRDRCLSSTCTCVQGRVESPLHSTLFSLLFLLWKSIWLMKNIKFPQTDISLQPKHLQSLCSADTRVFYLFLCKWSVDFMCISMRHIPTAVNSDSTYELQRQFAPSSSFFPSNSKTFMFSEASRFLSYVFSPFSFLRTVYFNRIYPMKFDIASSFICYFFDRLD
jgi:hypothetical protein